ncbi:MAG: sugar ABC transporter permease, partial [Bacteroidales bacterium]|nr:sugar ABC transporter permease [Bacteroidales bacterium]
MEALDMNQYPIPAKRLQQSKSYKQRVKRWIEKNWQMTTMIILPFAYIFIFCYIPMYGAQIAFKDYKASLGIWGSPWVGFKHFTAFFKSYLFWRVIRNTLVISLYSLVAGTPIPIILAIALNCTRNEKFRKTVQLVTYAPHFISTVVLVGILMQILSPKYGLVNTIITTFGGTPIDFMSTGKLFPHLYVWSGIWQNMGFSAIIYISALSGIDPSL